MKKPYTEPEFEAFKLTLKAEVLFHSPFERGGTNTGWDWNDDDIPISEDFDSIGP